ncbi:MAG: Na+/proline symporter [Patescibacteria group bacterium]|nr:Na+/proline symporter [Patescibacteria group bacterium]
MKLSFKLLTVTVGIAVVCLGVALALVYGAITTAIQGQINARQLEISHQTIDKIDRFMAERQVDIQALGQQDQLQRFISARLTDTSKAEATNNMNAFKAYAADWSDLGILDLNGSIVASTNAKLLGPKLLSDYPQLSELYQRARKGEIAYSDAFPSLGTHKAVFVYMAPIRRNGTVVGVVGGNVAWSSVISILQSVKGSTANLVNRDGLLLGDNEPNDEAEFLYKDYSNTAAFAHARSKAADSTVLPELDHPKKQAVNSHVVESGYKSYRGNGWILILDTPTDVAFGPARRLTFSVFGIIAAVVVLGILAIFFFVNRSIMQPIRLLSRAVNRVALGDLTQTVNVKSRDELGVLGRNFNEMTFQLADTHRGLETASRAAKEDRAQLESSINSLRQGFILTDGSGGTTILNQSARKMFGARNDSDELSLETIAKVLPEDLNLVEQVHQTLFKHKPAKFTYLPIRNRFVSLYLTPVLNENSPIGCVLLFDDVTEERILQRSRDEFFSIASHELRTPLTAIRGNAALIEQYYPKMLEDSNLREMVQDIHASSTRLIEIVNDFLDASRLEQGKMKFEYSVFSVEEVIEKVIYELAGVSRDKKLYLRFEHNPKSLPQVYADLNRVKQIVYNLIGNAMKFTETGGITIRAEIDGRNLKVLINDSGRGISEEGQQLLFHKFQQTGASLITRDTTRGTGLGLYISKLLAERMGGRIRLEKSEIDKGSVFSFSLPLAEVVNAMTKPASAAAPTKAKRKA